jgi:type I restriction enzyme, R subunit
MPRKNDYSEDRMLQQGSAEFFAQHLGWRSVYAFDTEDFGPNSLLGRSSRRDMVLVRELRAALQRLNPKAPAEAIAAAISLLCADEVGKNLTQHNQSQHRLLVEGVTVEVRDAQGKPSTHTLRVLEFAPEKVAHNDFLIVRELWLDDGHLRRPDLIGFVNGLPLLLIELKRYDQDISTGYTKNLTDYKRDIRRLFYHNALVVISNGHDARFGSVNGAWEHFYRWRRINEDDPMPPPDQPLLETLLRGLCNKTTLLDMVQNFTLFDASSAAAEPSKIVARNHQYLGVNRVIARLQSTDPETQKAVADGKLGVFWHTQGSGKSYSMVFFVRKVLNTVSAKYAFLVVTDRLDLDKQIASTFANCGQITDANAARIADSASVEARLKKSMRVQFCLVQKFRRRPRTAMASPNLIVLSDEAHRTQNGALAKNMREALRASKFLGFTGTPLIETYEKELTRQVFGQYVSIYDFKRAVQDDSTVPLYYQNRGGNLALIDPEIHAKIRERIELARQSGQLDEDQEDKLYRKLAQEYPIVSADTRLRSIAQDLVTHFSARRITGKAMLVCWDKLTCGRMYQFVQDFWQQRVCDIAAKLAQEQQRLALKSQAQSQYAMNLQETLRWLQETEICVVISNPESKELAADYALWGLDLAPHAEKMRTRALDEEFKRPEHPFRLVIVCGMWLTGFDVKSLATLYLDKPMQGHTLMQAIARVNRVYRDKKSGLVVDYNGMVRSLRKAMARYAIRRETPDVAPDELPLDDDLTALAEFANALSLARAYLNRLNFDLDRLIGTEKLARLDPLAFAINCIKRNVETKVTFNALARNVFARFTALFPHDGLTEHYGAHDALVAIYNKLNEQRAVKSVALMLRELSSVVDDAIEFEGLQEDSPHSKQYNLSTIDVERLQQEFAQAQRQAELFDLDAQIEARLAALLQANPTRVNLVAKYLQIIEQYNRERSQAEIERLFAELIAMQAELDREALRFVREGFANEQELAIFDLLSKDKLSKAEIQSIKQVAQSLLRVLSERQALAKHWQQRAASAALVESTIRTHLWQSLPEGVFPEATVEALTHAIFGHLARVGDAGDYANPRARAVIH